MVVVGLLDAWRAGPLVDALRVGAVPWRAAPGVDLRGADPARLADLVDQRAARVLVRRELTGPEVGCALAHRAGVEAGLAADREWCVVLEDDARVDARFDGVVAELARWRSPHPTVVLLHTAPRGVVRPRGGCTDVAVELLGAADGAFGYALNRAAMRLYPVSGPVRAVADWPYPWSARVRFWRLRDPCVMTGDVASTIGAPRDVAWQVREPVARRLWRVVASMTGVRYLTHRDVYGSWADYVGREVVVMAAHGVRRWSAAGGRRAAA